MVIDFRARPMMKGLDNFFRRESTIGANIRFGAQVAPSYLKFFEDPEQSVEMFIQEMKEHGIDKAVITGRNIPRVEVSNDDLAAVVGKYPNQLVGFAGIDPSNMIHQAIPELERCIKELGLSGVNMDPGLSALRMYPSDRKIYPIYAKIAELGVPLIMMTGPMAGPDLTYTDPAHISQIASDFPTMNIICGHGCWPYVTQAIGLMFRHRNVFVAPDVYMWMPGRDLYVDAANKLSDQFLYASAYPFRPLDSVIEYKTFGFTDEALEKSLNTNAAKLLKL
jgi:predicted TIM-barrel fold metal-dependent hydrolase